MAADPRAAIHQGDGTVVGLPAQPSGKTSADMHGGGERGGSEK